MGLSAAAAAVAAAILLPGWVLAIPDDVHNQVHFEATQASAHALSKITDWNVPPHRDATGNLIFNSVGSLMQLWPNTVWRHGTQHPFAFITTHTDLNHTQVIPWL